MSLLTSYKTLKEYRSDPLAFIEKLHLQQGHRIPLKIFGKELLIVSHPDDVLHVLKSHHATYSKGRTTKALRQFLGTGLITNEGESWRKQHKLIRPVMNLKSVFALAPKIFQTCQEFLPELENKGSIDSLVEMNRLTWRIILRTLFSQEITPEMEKWLEDILDLMRIITSKTRSSIPLPFWVPTSKNLRMRAIIKKFDEHVFGLIEQRRKGDKKQDLLQLLIDAQEEGVTSMSDREIRDEIMTFMMAGHETITNSMTWTLMELSQNKHYLDKLYSEAAEFFKDQDFEKLNAMPWMSAVIDEVMRLWPPVWVFMRQAESRDQIGDVHIAPGANVVLAPYLSHRSQDLWEKPQTFYPERFLPEQKKKIPTGAFYPFGLGPRACIGAYFAGLEAKIILSTLIYHYDWDLIKKEKQTYEAGISLRPVSNVKMKFRRRS